MIIGFREHFALPVETVFEYFLTPGDWVRLYGFGGRERSLGGGWYRIPLRRFPFPLVVRVTKCEPNRLVRWTFRGFWKGEGEVRFHPDRGGVSVSGFEAISIRWLFGLSRLLERAGLEDGFRELWRLGWSRLRRLEETAAPRRQDAPALGIARRDPHEFVRDLGASTDRGIDTENGR